MKLIIATLFAGGTFVGAEMPTPGSGECAIVSTEIEYADETLIDPTPVAESLRIIVYCGHAIPTDMGNVRTERALKIIDVDLEQAQVLIEAAFDLVDEGDVFLPGEG